MQLYICLIIFLLAIISFSLGKISMGTTAMLAMVALVLTGCLDAKTAISFFANPSVILIGSMFILSAGLSKTRFILQISQKIAKISNGSFRKILFGYIVIVVFLAQIIPSPLGVFSVVFPLAMAMSKELHLHPAHFMFPLGLTSVVACGILPLGGTAPIAAQLTAMLEAFGFTGLVFTEIDMMVARLPSLIFLVIYAVFLAPKFIPKKDYQEEAVQNNSSQGNGKAGAALTPLQDKLGAIIFFAVVICLILQTHLPIPHFMLPLIGAVLMVAFGVLKSREVYGALGSGGTCALIVGTLALSTALTATGAGDLIGAFMQKVMGGISSPFVLNLLFFLVPFALTQLMMNTAVSTIFTPIVMLTCKALGANPIGPIILVTAAALTAFMTPMATPVIPIMMSLGDYSQKDLLKMSAVPSIALILINVIWVTVAFPLF